MAHTQKPTQDLGPPSASGLGGPTPMIDPQGTLQSLLEGLRSEIGCERVSVAMNQRDGGRLYHRILAASGDPIPVPAEWASDEPEVLDAGEIPEYVQEQVRPDLAAEENRHPLEDALVSAGYRSYVLFPLISEGKPLGTLHLVSRRPGFFTERIRDRVRTSLEALTAVTEHLVLLRRHRQQSHFLAIAQELIEDLGPTTRLRETSQYITRRMIDLLDVDRAAIYLVNGDVTWLTCEALQARDGGPGGDRGLLPSLRIESTPILGKVLTGNPVSLLRPSEHLALPRTVSERLGLQETGALLLVPILRGEAPMGVLLCQRREARVIILTEEKDSVRLLGHQIGLILHSRQAVESQERSAKNFAELLDMSHAVSSTVDLSQVPGVVARRARDLCEADEATLFLIEPDGVTLRPAVCLGAYTEQVMKVRLRVGEGITGTVAARRRGEIINRAELDPRSMQIPDTPLEPEAVLAVPLVSGDRLEGVLTLHKLEGRIFDPVDLDTVEIFSSAAAIAIENARLFSGIREERTRLVTMLHHMEEGVIFAGKNGNVLLLNTAARRMLNLREGEYEGTPLADLLRGPDFQVVREALDRVRADEERNVTQEYTIRGRTSLCSVSAVHTGDGDDRSGEVLLFKDVTDLKEIENQLLQSSKMSAVGQLAAGVAHEFNNLIASIYGYAQFMKEHKDPEVVEKGVEVILRSSERARELTSSLLTFSRRRPGRREPVDLNQILTDTLLLLNRQFEKSGIRVEREAGRLPLTVADPGKMQQVFLNLLINAQQAMAGGGKLTVRTRSEGGNLEIRVEDTGPGIQAEHLPRIFEPFFTTKGALSGAKTPGTGLGLSTAYNIVRDHGGTIRVNSAPGAGAAFVVTLPTRTLHDRREEEGGPRLPRSLDATGRILVVDDDATLRELVGEILQGLGHQIEYAGDGLRAAHLLEHEAADLLIISQALSGLDSMEIYRRVRARRPRFPVIFITDRTSGTPLEADGDPWVFRLNKPFRNRDLIALVSRVLTQSLRRAS